MVTWREGKSDDFSRIIFLYNDYDCLGFIAQLGEDEKSWREYPFGITGNINLGLATKEEAKKRLLKILDLANE